jgi:type I restriction enzyme S subunit
LIVSPPLEEQALIREFLDQETSRLDRLAENVQSAIDKLKQYRTALITNAVTGKIDVRMFP